MAGILPEPLVIEQGATFRKTVIWQDADGVPVDITGYTAVMHVKADKDDVSPLVELTTENGRITLNEEDGELLLGIGPLTTAALDDWGRGYFDLKLTAPDTVVTRLLEGVAVLSREVTIT
jgi:hypothetical protein